MSFSYSLNMDKNPAAVALGTLGGSKTSEKKKKAAAQNLEKAREAKKLKATEARKKNI